MHRYHSRTRTVGAMLLVALAVPCFASYTSVGGPAGSEAGHLEILAAYYSPDAAWLATGVNADGVGTPVDFSNGTLTAQRVDDFGLGAALDPLAAPGQADDQVWQGGEYEIHAVARYAGYSQIVGHDVLGDDQGYLPLFTISGSGMNVTGHASLTVPADATFAWIRSGNKGGIWSSDMSQNSDGADHMVTYYISGIDDGYDHWLLFFEDLPNAGDHDYNDLVVEVVALPEPGTLLGLLPLMLTIIRRRG